MCPTCSVATDAATPLCPSCGTRRPAAGWPASVQRVESVGPVRVVASRERILVTVGVVLAVVWCLWQVVIGVLGAIEHTETVETASGALVDGSVTSVNLLVIVYIATTIRVVRGRHAARVLLAVLVAIAALGVVVGFESIEVSTASFHSTSSGFGLFQAEQGLLGHLGLGIGVVAVLLLFVGERASAYVDGRATSGSGARM